MSSVDCLFDSLSFIVSDCTLLVFWCRNRWMEECSLQETGVVDRETIERYLCSTGQEKNRKKFVGDGELE